jgi:hypothetical protein
MANHKRRNTTIHIMDDPDGEDKSTEEIVEVATKYYKDIFKYEVKPDINIATDFSMKETWLQRKRMQG